jgi:hypothetical protein
MCYWHGTLFYQVMNRNLFSFVNTMGLTAAREKKKKMDSGDDGGGDKKKKKKKK